MADFRTFRVLLDDPATVPALGYAEYAEAFAEVIRHSEPQFAIGIFGDWGSGKTTLMRAIMRKLQQDPAVVAVWFNAWRYERESDLIVPLLDTLREALDEWAAKRRRKRDREKATGAAAAVGRAAVFLLRATTFRVGLPGLGLDIDPSRGRLETEDESGPLSFYHRSFNAMREAIAGFVRPADETDRAHRRVVVFIDDLDRCLPESALQVLESMKLFFDLEGFVFVVGLDREVIERSVESKYRVPQASGVNGAALGARTTRESRPVSGADYIKKIFQVPFGLPRISIQDLRPFFDSLIATASLPKAQQVDLKTIVWPHLVASTAGASVNPREIKRLINAYTIQMKMLTGKLSGRGQAPRPNVVLALQVMAFRADWERFYELLSADPQLFVNALRGVVDEPGGGDFSLTSEPLPRSLVDYVRTTGARELLVTPNLDVYVTTAEATRSSDPQVLEVQAILAQLGRRLDDIGTPAAGLSEQVVVSELHDKLSIVHSMLGRRTSPLASEAVNRARALQEDLKSRVPQPSTEVPQQRPEWATRAGPLLVALQETLGAMRQEASVGSASA